MYRAVQGVVKYSNGWDRTGTGYLGVVTNSGKASDFKILMAGAKGLEPSAFCVTGLVKRDIRYLLKPYIQHLIFTLR